MLKLRQLTPVAIGVVLVASACSAGSTTSESSSSAAAPSEAPASSAPASAPAAAGDYTAQAAELDAMRFDQLSKSLLEAMPAPATLKDGSTFTLNPDIAAKIANGEPINYVISYGSKSIPLFGQQYGIGYEKTLPVANSILPMNGQDVSPSTPGQDVSAQIAGRDEVGVPVSADADASDADRGARLPRVVERRRVVGPRSRAHAEGGTDDRVTADGRARRRCRWDTRHRDGGDQHRGRSHRPHSSPPTSGSTVLAHIAPCSH